MATDPNWLYSTIAQSSAAIVAIVGGFITASVLMLTAEKRSLTSQLREKQSTLEILQKRYDEHPKGSPHYDDWVRKEGSGLDKEIYVLNRYITDLNYRTKTFSYPQNLWRGAAILGFLSVFGILLPVVILAYEAFYTWAKILTTVTFGLGIIIVFAYIVFQIGELMRK